MKNYAQAWKFLKEQTAKIQDPLLRNSMIAEFKKRALAEWGFDPETGNLPTLNDIDKDPWEEDFAQDMQIAQKFNMDVREEKRKKTLDETVASMRHFVSLGGKLSDIPDDIRTPYIEKLYIDALLRECEEWCQAADFLIQNGETKNDKKVNNTGYNS